MKQTALALGIGEATVPLGAHIAFWYRTPEEKFATLADYFRAGLDAGQHCMCLLPEADLDAFTELASRRFGEALRGGRLQVAGAAEFYFKGGRFHPNRLIASYPAIVQKALDAGFPSIRAAGEMPWRQMAQLSMPSFFEYEERVNRDFFDLYPVLGMCLFDMERWGTEWTLGILRTHPVMLANGVAFDNPSYYQS